MVEPPTPSSVREVIAGLANGGQPIRRARLTVLSHLDPEGLRLLEEVWAGIRVERRRQIMSWLVELAEDNFELDFARIFWRCLKDEDAEVRCRAIDGLGENEETVLINPLIEMLEHDSSVQVQEAAASALVRFALLAEHEKLRSCHGAKLSRALLAASADQTRPVEVRRRALEAVAPLSLPQVKEAIGEAYHGGSAGLKISAVYAMGRNCDISWLPLLLKELGSADAEMRYEAAGACGELGEEEAVPHLIRLIADADVDVRLAALQALGEIGGTEARECLERCRNDPGQAMAQMAEQALRELEMLDDPFSLPF